MYVVHVGEGYSQFKVQHKVSASICIHTVQGCTFSKFHKYGHTKTAPGLMLIQVNFDPIQEIGPRRLVLFWRLWWPLVHL